MSYKLPWNSSKFSSSFFRNRCNFSIDEYLGKDGQFPSIATLRKYAEACGMHLKIESVKELLQTNVPGFWEIVFEIPQDIFRGR